MTSKKDEEITILVDEIKSKIANYYKDYEACIDKQLEEFDVIIDKLTKINEERLIDVNDAKHNVITIVENDAPVGSKIEQIKTKFDNIYTKMNKDYTALLKLSNFDHLTTLMNRRQFDIHIEKACKLNSGCYLVMIDIDNFKSFNDNYGHLIGDQALKLVSSIIKKLCKPYSYLPFRFGGEEFVILMPKTNENEAFKISDSIREAISKHPFMVKDDKGYIKYQDVKITISLGITKIVDNDTVDKCIERADKAIYYSKKSGKNKTCVYEKLADMVKKE